MKLRFIEEPKAQIDVQQMDEILGGAAESNSCGDYEICPSGETGKNICKPFSCTWFRTSCTGTREWVVTPESPV